MQYKISRTIYIHSNICMTLWYNGGKKNGGICSLPWKYSTYFNNTAFTCARLSDNFAFNLLPQFHLPHMIEHGLKVKNTSHQFLLEVNDHFEVEGLLQTLNSNFNQNFSCERTFLGVCQILYQSFFNAIYICLSILFFTTYKIFIYHKRFLCA